MHVELTVYFNMCFSLLGIQKGGQMRLTGETVCSHKSPVLLCAGQLQVWVYMGGQSRPNPQKLRDNWISLVAFSVMCCLHAHFKLLYNICCLA